MVIENQESGIQKFLSVNETFYKKLQGLCKAAFEYFGATQLCYSHIDHHGNAYVLNTDPELWRYYLESKSFINDPIVKHPSLLREGMAVWSTYDNEEYKNNTLKTFSEQFGIDHGISLIDKDDSGFAGFSFGGPKYNPDMVNLILASPTKVEAFKRYLEKELCSTIKILNENRVNFASLTGSSFYRKTDYMSEPSTEKHIAYLLGLGLLKIEDLALRTNFRQYVTAREAQCALLILHGMSREEISKVLGISRAGVNSRITILKEKLNLDKQEDILPTLQKLYEMGCFSDSDLNKPLTPNLKPGSPIFQRVPRELKLVNI